MNAILIGKKPIKAYIVASTVELSKGANTLVLKARGRAITKAVNVAEILKRTQNLKVKDIVFNSELVTTKDNRQKMISTIEIVLEK